MIITHLCGLCGGIFQCIPSEAPIVRVNGVESPVCRACIERANRKLCGKGLLAYKIDRRVYEEPSGESQQR